MAEKGVGSDRYTGGITDLAGNSWTLSQGSVVSTVRGNDVNKGGVSTSFPLKGCSQLYYDTQGNMNGKLVKGAWYQWNGSTWVITHNKREM